jgi:soluble lytic murein transglycosylase
VPSSLFLSALLQDPASTSAAKPAQDIPTTGTSSAKKTPPQNAPSGKKTATSSTKHHYVNARKPRTVSPRVRRMRQAFVASASLRPMAQQLLQDRSLPAYAGVQAYARAHAKEDAGALAWLVLGYAHVLDKDYAIRQKPWRRWRTSPKHTLIPCWFATLR